MTGLYSDALDFHSSYKGGAGTLPSGPGRVESVFVPQYASARTSSSAVGVTDRCFDAADRAIARKQVHTDSMWSSMKGAAAGAANLVGDAAKGAAGLVGDAAKKAGEIAVDSKDALVAAAAAAAAKKKEEEEKEEKEAAAAKM